MRQPPRFSGDRKIPDGELNLTVGTTQPPLTGPELYSLRELGRRWQQAVPQAPPPLPVDPLLRRTGHIPRPSRFTRFAPVSPHWRRSLVVNGTGAVASGAVLLTAAVTKFAAGAWVVVVGIPLAVACLLRVKAHYTAVERATIPDAATIGPDVGNLAPPGRQGPPGLAVGDRHRAAAGGGVRRGSPA